MRSSALLIGLGFTAIAAISTAADKPATPTGAPKTAATTAVTTAPAPTQAVFATVGDITITAGEYDALWQTVQRQKFYHRKAPEAEVEQLRREVGDQIINQALLSREIVRRGVPPDTAKVQARLADYERQYGGSPMWARIQSERLPALTKELERQSSIERLATQVRAVEAPDEATAKAYYDAHPDRFTEPEQIRFSVILLKVDPSSPKAAWQKAREEAAAIRERIARGADFADLAKLHSSDVSAERGGDMGYVHRGMLPEGLAERLTTMTPLSVSDPVGVLEGVAILKLVDRKPAKLREFVQVRERAGQLWAREESERRWQAFLGELRRNAQVTVVDASRYPPAPASR